MIIEDPWEHLKKYTSARIAMGRAGSSLPSVEWLNFKLSYARARDAVHREFDPGAMADAIRAMGIESLVVRTCARDRASYLQRPDLGRRLEQESRSVLKARTSDFDLVIIASDGLSAMAAENQLLPLLRTLLPKIHRLNWKLAPIIVAPFARVAIEDEIGCCLNAKMALVLLGERPGLGSPDSLGAYLVYNPRTGTTDAQRNCVSNIRPQGQGFEEAADTLIYLLSQALHRQLSGLELKDERKKIEAQGKSQPKLSGERD